MNTKEAIRSQYHAALEMLRQAVSQCPDPLWDDPGDKNKFWHVAYHAVFYTHLYLQPGEEDFKAWPQHRDQYQFMGPLPWPPHDLPKIGAPYRKEEVLAYLDDVCAQVDETVAALDMDAESSGFSWLPLGKLELQFYNLRHLQQHTGELMERLGSRANIDVEWRGKG